MDGGQGLQLGEEGGGPGEASELIDPAPLEEVGFRDPVGNLDCEAYARKPPLCYSEAVPQSTRCDFLAAPTALVTSTVRGRTSCVATAERTPRSFDSLG